MSDATLPPPRTSSAAPTAEAAQQSDSSFGEGEFDTFLESCVSAVGKEESVGDGEGRTDNKQKRKRTRYVWELWALHRIFCCSAKL